MGFKITKWTRHITDDGKDKVVSLKPEGMTYHFRLLDDDKVVYAYGYSDRESFAPLDYYMPRYGCTEIQYYEKRKWITL